MQRNHNCLIAPMLLVLSLLCFARTSSQCDGADDQCGLQQIPEETPGSALWQLKRQIFLKTALSETSSDHADGSTPLATSEKLGPGSRSSRRAASQRKAAGFWGAREAQRVALQQASQRTLQQEPPKNREYGGLEEQVQDVETEGVVVIVPGLGSEDRAETVEKNIQWLKEQDVPFECWIFVYRTQEELPLDEARFSPCLLIRRQGFWLSHLLELPLNITKKPWVLHMEESSEAQPDMNLKRMIEIMVANNIGHAAPTFDTKKTPNPYGCDPPCGCCGSLYPVLARQENVSIGRFVDFIELHIDLFTRDYFACFQDYIDTSDKNMLHGWGMDRLLPALCGGAVGGSEVEAGHMGLFDQMTMEKRHHGSYDSEAAYKGMITFVEKHPNTPGPTFESFGELEAPENA